MNQYDQEELLQDVAKSLREISLSMASIADGLAIIRRRDASQPIAPVYSQYMSGRWYRRDGDTYGIVQAQPAIQEPRPEPPVHADDKTGHL